MKRIMSSISTKLALIVMGGFIIMIVGIIGATIYVYSMNRMEIFEKEATDISTTLAAAIDGDEYKNIIETQEKNAYWTELLNLFNRTKRKTGFRYVYAIDTAPSGSFRYVVEGYVDGEDMNNIYDLGEIADLAMGDLNRVAKATRDQKTAMVTDIYTFDGEKMLTGLAPIFDSSNNIVGVVGSDVSLQKITSEVVKFAIVIICIGGVVSLLFLIFIYYYIRQHVGKPITGLANSASEIAEGNLNINMIKVRHRKHKDEIGILADSFTKFTSTITDITNEINILSEKHEEGDLEYFIDSEKYKGAYAEVAVSANKSIKSYIDLTYDMLFAIEKLAEGDFSYDMKQYKGKRSNINAGMSSLKQTFGSIATDLKTLVDSGRNGNLTTRIESDTYLGVWKDIIHSLNELMAAFAAPITEAVIALDAISYGNFDNRIDNEYNGDFNKIALSLNSTSETISSYINEIGTVIYKISQGDLTVSINREYVGAFSKIKDSINAIIHILKTTIIDVNAASRQIVIGAEQVSNSAMNVAQGASEQAMNIAELSNFFTEINVRMKKSTAEAKKAGSLSARSVKKAADCSAEMNLLLSAMEGIKTSSKKISTIISAIEEIALQTNLLALNASVEAAHVGAAGKGFGVVADSVRGLAGRSKRAVRQTEDFINESILHVNDGSERATDASDTFGRIVADIDRSADLVGRVSDFCEKQSEDIHEISKRVGQMSKVVHSNSAMCEEFAAASEELNSQAQVLKEAVSFFNL